MPLIILENFKDLNLSAASIARKFHVSDTYVMKAASELNLLIAEYKSCEFSLFREFARLLQKHRSAIIRSFSIVDTRVGKVRPSNGPTESLNRRPKDMKRNARGYSNFEHVRNRILFALPMEAPILPKPREKKEFRKDTGKVRGPYKKKSGIF